MVTGVSDSRKIEFEAFPERTDLQISKPFQTPRAIQLE